MGVTAITVTEFSSNLSNFLSQVQYQGQSLDIQRGKRVIARVLPALAGGVLRLTGSMTFWPVSRNLAI